MTTIHSFVLPEMLEIPAAFKAAYYTPDDVLKLLRFDELFGETAEHEFWLAYKQGFIPAAVWLPSEPPLAVWDRNLIDQWIEAGCPPGPNVVEHSKRVLNALLQSVEESLPANPVVVDECN